MSDQPKKLTSEQWRTEYAQSKGRMIRKLLALGYQMGYDKPTAPEEESMRQAEVCKLHVNRWLLSEKSKYKKPMEEMSYRELVKSVTQFQAVYNDFKRRL